MTDLEPDTEVPRIAHNARAWGHVGLAAILSLLVSLAVVVPNAGSYVIHYPPNPHSFHIVDRGHELILFHAIVAVALADIVVGTWLRLTNQKVIGWILLLAMIGLALLRYYPY